MSGGAELRHQLQTIARRARDVLREEHTKRAALEALDSVAMLLLLAVPALQLLVLLLARTFGLAGGKAPLWIIVAGSVLPPVLYVFGRAFGASRRRIGELAALATVDRQLELEDRFVTAEEFLRVSERTPFMEAAVVDAARFAQAALESRVSTNAAPWRMRDRDRGLLVLALVVFAVVVGWSPLERAETPMGPAFSSSPEVGALTPRRTGDDEDDAKPELARLDPEIKPPRDARPSRAILDQPGGAKGELTSETKKTRGRTEVGQSSQAVFASGASESKGTPTAQGQSSMSTEKKSTKKAKKRSRKPESKYEPEKERKPQEMSGATAGRGAASGSQKSPSSSEWSSKDQVVSEDEEDLEDDEEVDDEFDDSDARGGLQPNLRDRKPPVNRDLSIGYGNQKNPDANGRGGASEQKKSRGVASLVLGVPIPDHVKGRPNPGKTKITQERVEPEADDAEPLEATSRTHRATPVGHLSRPDLLPWMREMLKSYYLSLRNEEVKSNP